MIGNQQLSKEKRKPNKGTMFQHHIHEVLLAGTLDWSDPVSHILVASLDTVPMICMSPCLEMWKLISLKLLLRRSTHTGTHCLNTALPRQAAKHAGQSWQACRWHWPEVSSAANPGGWDEACPVQNCTKMLQNSRWLLEIQKQNIKHPPWREAKGSGPYKDGSLQNQSLTCLMTHLEPIKSKPRMNIQTWQEQTKQL